jgi:NADP-dependent 3-hydroxy acid dehydrogenase YdfG
MRQRTTERTGAGWAVVTGASSGLGREFALALAERRHPILAVARRGERLRALADEVDARGGRLEPLVADLSTTVGVEALLARAASLELELLVNNAGVATYGPFASTPMERERDLVRVNVEAIVALTGGLLPALLARGDGGVINVASQMAFQPMPYFAAYAASKAFVLSFSEALRGAAGHEHPRDRGRTRFRRDRVHRGRRQPRTRTPLPAPTTTARRRIRPPRPRPRSNGEGRRPPLRPPDPRRAVRAAGRRAPDDGARPAAAPGSAVEHSRGSTDMSHNRKRLRVPAAPGGSVTEWLYALVRRRPDRERAARRPRLRLRKAGNAPLPRSDVSGRIRVKLGVTA